MRVFNGLHDLLLVTTTIDFLEQHVECPGCTPGTLQAGAQIGCRTRRVASDGVSHRQFVGDCNIALQGRRQGLRLDASQIHLELFAIAGNQIVQSEQIVRRSEIR
ncbi:hypothetical protein D3C73_1444290 [compost metagenome]